MGKEDKWKKVFSFQGVAFVSFFLVRWNGEHQTQVTAETSRELRQSLRNVVLEGE